ncbi:unnamed protein product [Bemisia tabaci]|uniref:SCP domain-containing protein n=1 Tax=Bemisia tabaci TaxID=7038 RepID=A0A9P0CBW0_BEMTA|nr:unnamed protein product [Bemisia tabaci]
MVKFASVFCFKITLFVIVFANKNVLAVESRTIPNEIALYTTGYWRAVGPVYRKNNTDKFHNTSISSGQNPFKNDSLRSLKITTESSKSNSRTATFDPKPVETVHNSTNKSSIATTSRSTEIIGVSFEGTVTNPIGSTIDTKNQTVSGEIKTAGNSNAKAGPSDNGHGLAAYTTSSDDNGLNTTIKPSLGLTNINESSKSKSNIRLSEEDRSLKKKTDENRIASIIAEPNKTTLNAFEPVISPTTRTTSKSTQESHSHFKPTESLDVISKTDEPDSSVTTRPLHTSTPPNKSPSICKLEALTTALNSTTTPSITKEHDLRNSSNSVFENESTGSQNRETSTTIDAIETSVFGCVATNGPQAKAQLWYKMQQTTPISKGIEVGSPGQTSKPPAYMNVTLLKPVEGVPSGKKPDLQRHVPEGAIMKIGRRLDDPAHKFYEKPTGKIKITRPEIQQQKGGPRPGFSYAPTMNVDHLSTYNPNIDPGTYSKPVTDQEDVLEITSPDRFILSTKDSTRNSSYRQETTVSEVSVYDSETEDYLKDNQETKSAQRLEEVAEGKPVEKPESHNEELPADKFEIREGFRKPGSQDIKSLVRGPVEYGSEAVTEQSGGYEEEPPVRKPVSYEEELLAEDPGTGEDDFPVQKPASYNSALPRAESGKGPSDMAPISYEDEPPVRKPETYDEELPDLAFHHRELPLENLVNKKNESLFKGLVINNTQSSLRRPESYGSESSGINSGSDDGDPPNEASGGQISDGGHETGYPVIKAGSYGSEAPVGGPASYEGKTSPQKSESRGETASRENSGGNNEEPLVENSGSYPEDTESETLSFQEPEVGRVSDDYEYADEDSESYPDTMQYAGVPHSRSGTQSGGPEDENPEYLDDSSPSEDKEDHDAEDTPPAHHRPGDNRRQIQPPHLTSVQPPRPRPAYSQIPVDSSMPALPTPYREPAVPTREEGGRDRASWMPRPPPPYTKRRHRVKAKTQVKGRETGGGEFEEYAVDPVESGGGSAAKKRVEQRSGDATRSSQQVLVGKHQASASQSMELANFPDGGKPRRRTLETDVTSENGWIDSDFLEGPRGPRGKFNCSQLREAPMNWTPEQLREWQSRSRDSLALISRCGGRVIGSRTKDGVLRYRLTLTELPVPPEKPSVPAELVDTRTVFGQETPDDSRFVDELIEVQQAYRRLHQAVEFDVKSKLRNLARKKAETQPSDTWLCTYEGHGCNAFAYSSTQLPISPTEVAATWYAESEGYNYTIEPDLQRHPYVGLFTQMVWASSQAIGCGRHEREDEEQVVVICLYTPPGNEPGKFLENVLPIPLSATHPDFEENNKLELDTNASTSLEASLVSLLFLLAWSRC